MRIRHALLPPLVVICRALTLFVLCSPVLPGAPPERLAHFDLMPKVAALPDGTLAAYFIEIRGPGLAPTPPVQDMKCRVSKDNGHTWGAMQSLFTLPKEAGGFGFHVVLVDQAGEVHFMMMCDDNTGPLRARQPEAGQPAVEPMDKQRLDVWHVRSTGGRTKWTKPKRIFEGRVSDLQSVIQLKSGRIVLPLGDLVRGRSWAKRGEGFAEFSHPGQFDATAIYSDDLGETWQKSKSVLRVPIPHSVSSYGAVEPVIVQLNDGRVWMLIRTQMGRFYESFSRDGSEWTPPMPTAIRSSDSPVGFVRLQRRAARDDLEQLPALRLRARRASRAARRHLGRRRQDLARPPRDPPRPVPQRAFTDQRRSRGVVRLPGPRPRRANRLHHVGRRPGKVDRSKRSTPNGCWKRNSEMNSTTASTSGPSSGPRALPLIRGKWFQKEGRPQPAQGRSGLAHRGGTKLSIRSARHGEAADDAGERLRWRDDHVDGPLLAAVRRRGRHSQHLPLADRRERRRGARTALRRTDGSTLNSAGIRRSVPAKR